VAVESARLEQRRGTLTFDKINEVCRVLHGEFSPLILAVFDVWRRVAKSGSGNKWRLLTFKSARLEQHGHMLTFFKGLRFLFYGTASLSHWQWPCSTCGVASRKPEVDINGGWWRLTVLGWNKLES